MFMYGQPANFSAAIKAHQRILLTFVSLEDKVKGSTVSVGTNINAS